VQVSQVNGAYKKSLIQDIEVISQRLSVETVT
jgi:hypothetical protein